MEVFDKINKQENTLSPKITFNNKGNAFFNELKKKVDDYFESNKLKSTGNYRLYLKGVYVVLSAVLLYVLLVFFTPTMGLALLFCSLLGVNIAVIGFNIMHDAAHGSFSHKKWINNFLSYSLNGLGGNVYLWKIKHNINHHTYTNISGMDDDIEIEPWIRVHSKQKIYWFHKFQFIYWVIFYGITYFLWIYVGDFIKYFSGKIASTTFRKMDIKEHIIFWATKVTYTGVFIVLPIFMVGVVNTIIGYTIVSFLCGFTLAIVFQLAHLTDSMEIKLMNESTNHKIEQEWAIHQISSTADFATRNRFISWFVGGLNFQVEHHLFPKVSHIHYPKINQFVVETCRKFNLKYHSHPSLWSALWSHILYLKKMGKSMTVQSTNEFAPAI